MGIDVEMPGSLDRAVLDHVGPDVFDRGMDGDLTSEFLADPIPAPCAIE